MGCGPTDAILVNDKTISKNVK